MPSGDLDGFLLPAALNCKRAISQKNQNTGHYLVIIHGFMSYNLFLESAKNYFLKQNFIVLSFQYSALQNSNERIANDYLKKFITQFCTDKSKKIFFISYTNGCDILIRYLKKNHSLSYAKIALINPPLCGCYLEKIINPLLHIFKLHSNNFNNLYCDIERLSNFHKIRIWKYRFNFLLKSKTSINLDITQEYKSQNLIKNIYEYFITKEN